jgi:hypothetical protein
MEYLKCKIKKGKVEYMSSFSLRLMSLGLRVDEKVR